MSNYATSAIVLFGHGARDPEWAGPIRRLADAIRAQSPAQAVSLAFLEFMSPTLPEAVEQLIAGGAKQVTVVPVFLAQGGHVRRDVPEMLERLRAAHPAVSLRLAAALGESDAVIAAMAQVALDGSR
ncbi:CbiX/SirB N-terminal domain-containing protein [Viridibacterium curvum]|uniref:CbiX/SirB N-terminal domain-containing protein n=1 Tax=Viridibacterium curvum TaxID=1101404 RepID=A0ABP9QYH4_9RHOO